MADIISEAVIFALVMDYVVVYGSQVHCLGFMVIIIKTFQAEVKSNVGFDRLVNIAVVINVVR